MPDNIQRDANISRLFEKLDYVAEKVTITQNDIGILGVKIDDFSHRLKKLEERDEKHLEREEKLELLTTKMEAIISKGESTMEKLDSRVEGMEQEFSVMKDDIANLKKNWKMLMGIISLVGSIFGYVIKVLIDAFVKGT